MKTIIACGQFAPLPGDIPGNTEIMCRLAREAAQAGAALLVLPELSLCGYPSAADAPGRAVAASGREIAALAECAKALTIALCFGFAESAPQGGLRNSMAFVDAAGALCAVYRKVHLWITEKAWAEPGGDFPRFDACGIPAGMWICYDTRFPEAARRLAKDGASLGLVGSAWFGPAEEWELAMRARALDNGIYAAGAALQGSFGEAPFHGESIIVDPHGRVLARAAAGSRGVICAEFDSAVVEAFRGRLPLLADLRPDAYA